MCFASSEGQIQLCIISITVKIYVIPPDDITKGKHADIRDRWSQNRPLGDTMTNPHIFCLSDRECLQIEKGKTG